MGETGMKLMYFDDFRLGILKADNVVDVSDVVQDVPHIGPHDLINGVIERFAEYRPKIEAAVAGRPGVPVSGVRIRPPLPKPFNIVCMAVNYMEGRPEPAPINSFLKSPNSIIGPGDAMVLPDVPATVFEGEAELALVIGKRTMRVGEADAMGSIFGYINFVDGSARGLPPERNTYYQMKARETFAPIGPYIVTADEVKDPNNLRVRLWNNGALMQNYNTGDMAHKIPRCISWVSAAHTLDPGDILSLGTSHGGLNPFMDGDVIEQEVDGLGRLRFIIRDDLRRTWAHESRDQRKQRGEKGVPPQLTGKYAKI
jgi:2-keto-4-pentenoate hydratase/2-oxohepta-3-ene-1,7-dioic acid hydratase in catechol pathway